MDMPSWMPVIIYAIILMAFLGIYAWNHMDDSIGRSPFAMLVFLTAFMLATDLISRCFIYDGVPHLLVSVSTALTFVMLPSIATEWYQFLRSVLTAEERVRMRYVDYVVSFITAVGVIVVLMSPVTSWVYSFNDAGVYMRGDLFIAPAVCFFIILIIADVYLLFFVKSLGGASVAMLAAFPLPSAVGAVLSVLVPDIPWIPLGVSLSMVALFAHIQNTGMGRDYLTGLFNRKKLEELMGEYIDHAKGGRTFAAIMMDLDDFKRINDTYGHAVGDIALADTARLLRRSVRSGDAVARFGGDEFFVLLDMGEEGSLQDVVARIEEEEKAFARESDKYVLRLSKGYDVYDPDKFEDVKSFEEHLDKLMYADKEARRASRKAAREAEEFSYENRRRV